MIWLDFHQGQLVAQGSPPPYLVLRQGARSALARPTTSPGWQLSSMPLVDRLQSGVNRCLAPFSKISG
jgi:hypothetical protein